MDDEQTPIKCVCKACGKTFIKGSEGDNEELHLRCQRAMELEDEEHYESEYW